MDYQKEFTVILGPSLGAKLALRILGPSLGAKLALRILGPLLGAPLTMGLGSPLGIRLGAELAEIDGDAVGLELGFDVGVVVGVDVGESVFLHFLLHVAGQKNLTFFLPEPGWIFLHLFLGFSATYESHVRFALPSNRNESKFSHRPRVTVGEDVGESVSLHFLLHADGQKNFSFFPLDSGCIFSHLLTGLIATYKSHVLDELPSNLKSRSFEQSMMSASPSPAAIGRTIASVRRWSAAPSLTPFCTDRFFRDEMKLAWRISLTRRMVREEELPLRAARGRVNEVMSDLAGVGAAVGTALAALTRMGTRKALIYAKESFIMTTSFIML